MPASRVVPTHENDAAEPHAGDSVEALVAAADGVPARDSGEEVAPVRRSEDEDGGASGEGLRGRGAGAWAEFLRVWFRISLCKGHNKIPWIL